MTLTEDLFEWEEKNLRDNELHFRSHKNKEGQLIFFLWSLRRHPFSRALRPHQPASTTVSQVTIYSISTATTGKISRLLTAIITNHFSNADK